MEIFFCSLKSCTLFALQFLHSSKSTYHHRTIVRYVIILSGCSPTSQRSSTSHRLYLSLRENGDIELAVSMTRLPTERNDVPLKYDCIARIGFGLERREKNTKNTKQNYAKFHIQCYCLTFLKSPS